MQHVDTTRSRRRRRGYGYRLGFPSSPPPLGEFFLAPPLEMEGVGMIDTLSEEAS